MRTALRRDAIKEADVVTGATKGEKGEDEDQEFNNLFFLSLSLLRSAAGHVGRVSPSSADAEKRRL